LQNSAHGSPECQPQALRVSVHARAVELLTEEKAKGRCLHRTGLKWTFGRRAAF
jgi:hypothetical protein